MTEMKPEPTLNERLVGSIEAAIALRCLHIYLEARRNAEEAGGDVSALPVANHEHVGSRYQEIIDEWLSEAPASASAARAFLDLALVIMCDFRLTECALDCGTIAGDEKDREHAFRALAAVHDYLIHRETEDYLDKRTNAAIEAGRREARS